MTDRPKGLGLFCCAGGADAGYTRAGWDMTGVDIVDRPNYPGHPHAFVRADALEYLSGIIDSGEIERYRFVHASPPCQKQCALTVGTNTSRGWGGEHTDLVAPVRVLLDRTGLPYVIEQPNGRAEIRKDLTLCGEMFGLRVIRHRNLELGRWSVGTNRWAAGPDGKHPRHRGRVRGYRHGENFPDGVYLAAYGEGGGKATVPEMQDAMGIDWTEVREELTEALPPAYTEWIGRRLLEELRNED